jgi:hypothetical protein
VSAFDIQLSAISITAAKTMANMALANWDISLMLIKSRVMAEVPAVRSSIASSIRADCARIF